MVLRDKRPNPRALKHQRDVEQIEDHDADQKGSRSAKEFPACDAEQNLHHEIQKRNALQIEAESRAPRHGEERDIGLVMNQVEDDMRKYREPDCSTDVGTPHRFAEAPRESGEKQTREYRVRVREKVQVDSIGSGADVFDSQIREQDPKKLNSLHRDQERPQTHSRISFLEDKRGRSMADRVRIASSCSWASDRWNREPRTNGQLASR
jgi:hypothetical protein